MSSFFPLQNTCHQENSLSWLTFWERCSLYIQALLKPIFNAFAVNAWFSLASFFYSHSYASTLTAIINGAESFCHTASPPQSLPFLRRDMLRLVVEQCAITPAMASIWGAFLLPWSIHTPFFCCLVREPFLCIPSLCRFGSMCSVSFISLLHDATKRPPWIPYLSYTYRGFQFRPHLRSQLHTLRSPSFSNIRHILLWKKYTVAGWIEFRSLFHCNVGTAHNRSLKSWGQDFKPTWIPMVAVFPSTRPWWQRVTIESTVAVVGWVSWYVLICSDAFASFYRVLECGLIS